MNNKVDDLVNIIDDFMANNGGHMNVVVDDNGDIKTEKEFIDDTSIQATITTRNANECTTNSACSVPTLFNGLDNE